MNRNTWAAAVSTAVVVIVIILGMTVLGGPAKQRMVQSDLRTVRAAGTLAERIRGTWSGAGRVLPPNLDIFPESERLNPITHQPFVYHPGSGSAYELCTSFATDSRDTPDKSANDPWAHPKGNYCFKLDAAQPMPIVPFYY